MRAGLTPLQAAAFRFIRCFIDDKGHSPSIDEIRLALESNSKSGTHRIVKALIERGYLVKIPHRPRALAIVDRGQFNLSREDEDRLLRGAAAAGMDLSSYIRSITRGAA